MPKLLDPCGRPDATARPTYRPRWRGGAGSDARIISVRLVCCLVHVSGWRGNGASRFPVFISRDASHSPQPPLTPSAAKRNQSGAPVGNRLSPDTSQTFGRASDSKARSAGFQPAVAPNFIRQTVRGRSDPQIENLRYGRLKTCATSFRDPMVQRGL